LSRTTRFALLALIVLFVSPTAIAAAAARMPVGFYDDDSFRWSPDVPQNLLAAQKAGASILHVTADWSQIAATKPANPLNGNDPAYKLADLDALVRNAGRYGFQVMINISRTPSWANGGQAPTYPPTNLNTLTQFSQMLAARYNGAPNHGLVLRWSIWNEPNLGVFLTPQYVNGKIASPAEWVKLYMAGYKGIKAGDKKALVAAGETSNQGRTVPLAGSQSVQTVAPATFAHMVSQIAPKLPFDAWATHPYPTRPSLPPTQKVSYPNVTLTTIDKFGASLQQWFHRRVPIWITEYAEQTLPQSTTGGVPYAQQAADAKLAMKMAAASPYVEMFIWFTFRDSPGTWQSGLETAGGAKKPSYAAFSATAHTISGQSQIVAPHKQPTLSVYVPFLAYHDAVGSKMGVTYQVFLGKKRVAVGQSGVKLSASQSVSFPIKFKPAPKGVYSATVNVGDKNGQHQVVAMSLTTS
jgi:hypothetical protein